MGFEETRAMSDSKQPGTMIARESGGVLVCHFKMSTLVFPNDIENAGRDLANIAGRGDAQKVVLDLSSLKQISSGFVTKLMQFSRTLAQRGGKLALCGMTPQVSQVFKILKLSKIFLICKDTFEATEALTG